jgi:hypothetical protein
MVRYALLALFFCSGSAAAFDPTHWVQVTGGAWEPDAVMLSELEAALKPAVTSASQGRGRMPGWSDYTFQYQGRIRALGGSFIYVKAFCRKEGANLGRDWVRVSDGGACYFSAKYDPQKKSIYDIEVNGFA